MTQLTFSDGDDFEKFFSNDFIENLPDNIVSSLSDKLFRHSIKKQISDLTKRLNNHDSRIGSLEIEQRQTSKTVKLIEHREQKRKEIQESFHEPDEIAKYLFDIENQPLQSSMSAQTINLFYFGFGLYTKNFIPNDAVLSKSSKKDDLNDKIFYHDVKRNKRHTFSFYPANTIKIKKIFETKLSEYGLLNEFYNAKDKEELRFIACYLSAIRLNKEYLKGKPQIDIDKLKDNPKQLIKDVKNHISILKNSNDDF